MKKIYVIAALLILIYGAAMPLICLSSGGRASVPKSPYHSAEQIAENTEKVRVLDEKSGKVTEISLDDYLFGVVAAEMPLSYNDEALKAQVVASYTYMLFRANERVGKNYDVVADSSKDQAFITRQKARERWGDNADKYTEKLEGIIDSVKGYVMVDENDMPILAAYHNISAGRTESAEIVWGSEYSYLKPVDSLGDLTSSEYLSEKSFSKDELRQKLSVPETDSAPSKWITDIETSDSGTVISLKVCGNRFDGTKLRSLLGLRSSVFTVRYSDEKFNFRVQGHGHGVGMSQFGANYLARQGYTYIEILSWYYTGCKMKQL